MMRLQAFLLCSALSAIGVAGTAVAGGADSAGFTAGGEGTWFMPDFRPWWSRDSIGDIRFDVGRSGDRLVPCNDWTDVGPAPTGMDVLSFTLSSPNFGQSDLRLRRNNTPDGIEMYQTISWMDSSGACYAVETQDPIAVIPNEPRQSGRWLPLAKFALYNVAEDGGLGDQVVCHIKRWCCLGSSPTCPTRGPCPRLPTMSDNLEAGSRDVYPFHWTDQYLPLYTPDDVPTGDYWFEDEINPGGLMWESDYTNNSMFMMVHIDREARTVEVTVPPDDSFAICPAT